MQIEETENFIVNNCEPSDNYKIDDKYLEDLKFPEFITEFKESEFITNVISEYGSLEWLKYAHENRCDWNEETSIAAAGSGNLNCLKYLHENGCSWINDM